ncbi:MAG TPA: hypothetical protein VN688_07555 [Gemmataceae bacterium]|nr:hypothetical protein [Gemmataceae bacterium]
MDVLWGLLFLTGFYPLALALHANRRTTLRQPLLWAVLAWATWTGVAWNRVLHAEQDGRLGPYLALGLTGCAGIAVLGARRPGVAAWNFVVVGLLAVLLLPVLNGLGEVRLETVHELFLCVILSVPLLNYLPTRLAPAVGLVAVGCGLEIPPVWGMDSSAAVQSAGLALLSVSPWIAWMALLRRGASAAEFDRLWLAYRDRFGFVWGQRMREQFNRAAHHAGWPVVLRWAGLRTTTPQATTDQAALLATLRGVLKRFGPDEEGDKLQGE